MRRCNNVRSGCEAAYESTIEAHLTTRPVDDDVTSSVSDHDDDETDMQHSFLIKGAGAVYHKIISSFLKQAIGTSFSNSGPARGSDCRR